MEEVSLANWKEESPRKIMLENMSNRSPCDSDHAIWAKGWCLERNRADGQNIYGINK